MEFVSIINRVVASTSDSHIADKLSSAVLLLLIKNDFAEIDASELRDKLLVGSRSITGNETNSYAKGTLDCLEKAMDFYLMERSQKVIRREAKEKLRRVQKDSINFHLL